MFPLIRGQPSTFAERAVEVASCAILLNNNLQAPVEESTNVLYGAKIVIYLYLVVEF